MKRNAFQKIGILLMLIAILSLTACGDKNTDSKGSTESVELSREAYIGLVGQYFGYDNSEANSDYFSDVNSTNTYYKYIQACAAWDVITAGGDFNPKSSTTMEFALATAVKAIGVNELQGVDGQSNQKALADYYVSNIAQLDKADYNRDITEEIAIQILQYALNYGNEVELPQIVEVEYQDSVKVGDDKIIVPLSGNKGILKDGHNYKVGDIVYIEETQNGYPCGVKITSIDGNTFRFENVDVDDVFSRLEISGTFEGNIVNVFSASENVSVYGGEIYYPSDVRYDKSYGEYLNIANGVKVEKGSNYAKFVASITEGKNKAEATVGINNIKVTVAYNHGISVLSPEDVKLNVTFDTFIDVSSELHYSKTIPLGSIDVNVWGPLFVELSLVANIGADGKVELNYIVHNAANVEWRKGAGITKGFTTSSDASAQGNVTLTAEVTTMADLVIKFLGEYSIVNGQITSGIIVIAKEDVDLLGNRPTCLDIFGYVPLKWGINQKGCLITKLNSSWSTKGVTWDASNSAINFHRHLEDGNRTNGDICSRNSEEKVIQDVVKGDGTVIDEYDLFEFERITFDFIKLNKYAMYLEEGETEDIEFTSVPEGYTSSTLIYTVDNDLICSVVGGKITAKASGTTMVRISSTDGMFSVAFAVVVNEDYSSDGEFIGL